MRSALLCGREHTKIGPLSAVAEGPAAITISRGGANKRYHYTEPNEDAALFAIGEGGGLVAVADGHFGARGAELVMHEILARCAQWTGSSPSPSPSPSESECESWERAALSLILDLNAALREDAQRRNIEPAPTTLSLALVRQPDDLLLHAAIGDSHIFRVGDDEVSELGNRSHHFLGDRDLDEDAAARIASIGCQSLSGTRAILLATDGLSEPGIGVEDPTGAVAGAVEAAAQVRPLLRPLEAARTLTERALESHREQQSGDNIACAVLWTSSPLGDLER